jgi:hypothetical protein
MRGRTGADSGDVPVKYALRLELDDDEIVMLGAAVQRGVQAFAADQKALERRARELLVGFVDLASEINARGCDEGCGSDDIATSTQHVFANVFTVKQIAELVGCSEENVRRSCRTGVLQPHVVRIGHRKIGVQAGPAREWIANRMRTKR